MEHVKANICYSVGLTGHFWPRALLASTEQHELSDRQDEEKNDYARDGWR